MTYPALWVASDGSFGVTDEPLVEAAYVVFQRGFFDGLRFFDASGREWLVESAALASPPGVLDKALDRRVHVNVQLSSPRPASVVDMAELLCTCVDRVADDLRDRINNLDTLKASIRVATTPAELIERVRRLTEAA